MTTRFDPQSGSFRLSGGAARALADLASERADPDVDVMHEMRAGRLLEKDRLHPRLVAVGLCLASPLTRLRVDNVLPTSWAVEVWLDDKIAVVLRWPGEPATTAEVVAVPRGMVALSLARLVALAPRERVKVDHPVDLDEGFLAALIGSSEGWTAAAIESMLIERDEVIPEWLELLSRLSNEPKRHWRVGAWWNSAVESPAARLLEVVEADVGSFLVSHHRDPSRRYRQARLHPLTSTQLWRLLCALVPAANEVDRPLVD